MTQTAFRPDPAIACTPVGQEGEPVLAIDGLLRWPGQLVDFAARQSFAPAYGPAGGYPGLRAPAPLDYVRALAQWALPLIRDAFALPAHARLGAAECNFSLVTLAPGALVPGQRVPHVDTHDPHQFAILHYLCDPSFGGTAFFRHRATGFETLSDERQPAYRSAREREGAHHRASGYPGANDPHFERIGRVDARFDRIAIYRSKLLHSGIIERPDLLTSDPARGRLTANIFLTVRT